MSLEKLFEQRAAVVNTRTEIKESHTSLAVTAWLHKTSSQTTNLSSSQKSYGLIPYATYGGHAQKSLQWQG
jgi:hypothetical protein